MTSRLTALGPAIHAFASVDEAFDELATNHGELPDGFTLPHTVTPASLRRDPAAPSRSVDDPQAPPTPTSRSAALAEPSTGSTR